MSALHRIAHWLGRTDVDVVSLAVGSRILIGARCPECGEVDWHDATDTIDRMVDRALAKMKGGDYGE